MSNIINSSIFCWVFFIFTTVITFKTLVIKYIIFQIDDCIQSCVVTNTMPPMVRRYRPVHKIYSAYQNLRKLKGPKHWYAGSNYFSNQASFNFRTNYYRRFKVSLLLQYFGLVQRCGITLGTIFKV